MENRPTIYRDRDKEAREGFYLLIPVPHTNLFLVYIRLLPSFGGMDQEWIPFSEGHLHTEQQVLDLIQRKYPHAAPEKLNRLTALTLFGIVVEEESC